MPVRRGSVDWKGGLRDGAGVMRVGANAAELRFDRASHDESGPGSSPEELLAAALAGSYSYFLAGSLSRAGYPPLRIQTTVRVSVAVGDDPRIESIEHETQVDVPDLDEGLFLEHAATAKRNCPVGRALDGAEITLTALLIGG